MGGEEGESSRSIIILAGTPASKFSSFNGIFPPRAKAGRVIKVMSAQLMPRPGLIDRQKGKKRNPVGRLALINSRGGSRVCVCVCVCVRERTGKADPKVRSVSPNFLIAALKIYPKSLCPFDWNTTSNSFILAGGQRETRNGSRFFKSRGGAGGAGLGGEK